MPPQHSVKKVHLNGTWALAWGWKYISSHNSILAAQERKSLFPSCAGAGARDVPSPVEGAVSRKGKESCQGIGRRKNPNP